ncbi:MAG TPA: pyridoxamine 5'-phosphate oxidase family protein [Solirubrobacteraceae bacterium]|nr:pyridoxamine 5'-phosphate oxidase family protein [Solirubrobacteraceae bacterium]
MSRRGEITMTREEVVAFLEQERTVACATIGPRGWPHVMPLWYVVRDGEVWALTWARSQKVRNLERDPRATLQVEAGDSYDELRGVMIEARAVIHRDAETIVEIGEQLVARHPAEPLTAEAVARQAPKRAALQFVAQRVASFDHRKLPTGVY